MARIGNESRFILRLASKRMETWLGRREFDSQIGKAEQAGEKRAVQVYKSCLNGIIAELENR